MALFNFDYSGEYPPPHARPSGCSRRPRRTKSNYVTPIGYGWVSNRRRFTLRYADRGGPVIRRSQTRNEEAGASRRIRTPASLIVGHCL